MLGIKKVLCPKLPFLTNPEKSLTPKPYASHIGKNCLRGLTPASVLLTLQVLTRGSLLDMTTGVKNVAHIDLGKLQYFTNLN